MKKIVIGARKSDLAKIQALDVGGRLKLANPELEIQYAFRESLGDVNLTDPLWKAPIQGVFTEDFVAELVTGRSDLIVHSWKDLPTEPRVQTSVVATLPRADARDVLLVQKKVWAQDPETLTIFSSSPRRAYNLQPLLAWALPPRAAGQPRVVQFEAVRGNIQTRIRKLIESRSVAGLVVAKAALDRLLSATAPEFVATGNFIRESLKECFLMVLPLGENPAAAGQGALAIEIRRNDVETQKLVQKIHCANTFADVTAERDILRSHGGGCHQKIGVTQIGRNNWSLRSLRGLTDAGQILNELVFKINGANGEPPKFSAAESFPQSNETTLFFDREPLPVAKPAATKRFWIARANAWPDGWRADSDDIVWAAGLDSWKKLAARGIWVSGCSEGLGEAWPMQITELWGDEPFLKLTHDRSAALEAEVRDRKSQPPPLATYRLKNKPIGPQFFKGRNNFFWMSASAFKRAIEIDPTLLARGYHGAGPGFTSEFVQRRLGERAKSPLNFQTFLNIHSWRNQTVENL